MKILIILNDPPYGTERSYNGIRMASAILKKDPETELAVFLMADAVLCAKSGQKTPSGYYNIEVMLKPIVRKGTLLLCGTCMDARGITDNEIMDGAKRSTMDELADKTLGADKIMVF
ncbi:MAG: DsrE family protein [Gammaproteobacteria bacterium]|nr:DsrE family protein [Gammaproteobacteria bacterium]MDH5594026.1 DsrE family protein [Gammaproteobacteria bacterium]